MTLNQDGTIILQGKHIQIIGDSQTTIIGQRVDINPEGTPEPTDEELEAWANKPVDIRDLWADSSLGAVSDVGDSGLHHIRNTFHSQPAGTETLEGFAKWASTADPNSYKIMSANESQYHNIGYQNRGINLKVVFFENQKSLNSSSEVIYSTKTGKMVTDALNGGTFNYYDNSKSTIGHILTDIIPYWASENNSNDPNSLSTRVFGMYSPMSAEYSGEATNPLIEFGGLINDAKTGYSKVDEYRKLYNMEHKKLIDKINFYKKK